jgi:hypothetical protein
MHKLGELKVRDVKEQYLVDEDGNCIGVVLNINELLKI